MNVLAPFDVSPVSERAIKTALDLVSGQRDVHVTAVHFSETADTPAEIAAHEIESMGADHDVAVDAEIHRVDHGLESKATIRKAITDLIDSNEIDLVVLGHEEKSLFEQLFRSDTTERVLDSHDIPVLLVP